MHTGEKKLPDSQTSTRKTDKMWHCARNRLFRLKRWRGLTPSSASCLPPPPPCSPLDYFPVRTDAISDCLGKARSSTSERGQGSDTCNKQSSVLFYPAPQKSENSLPILFLLFLMRNTLPLALNNAGEYWLFMAHTDKGSHSESYFTSVFWDFARILTVYVSVFRKLLWTCSLPSYSLFIVI